MMLLRALGVGLLLAAATVGFSTADAAHPPNNRASFTSEGCYIKGGSWGIVNSLYATETLTASAGYQCNWYYLSCSWIVGNNSYVGCAGWVQYPVTNSTPYGNTRGVAATHSACNPGGPCLTAVYKSTFHSHSQ